MMKTFLTIPKIVLFASLILASGNSFAQNPSIDSNLLLQDIRILSSVEYEGRRPGTDGHAKAMDYITNRFQKIGLKSFNTDFLHPFEIKEDLKGYNILGFIPGTQNDRYIVISGHYDHVGIRRDQIHPGADDNASGASALMAIAAYFTKHKPSHSLIFAAFDAEEMGLRGAYEFVKNPPVPLNQIVLNINMDMVSRNDQNRLVAAGTHYAPYLIPMLDQVQSDVITIVKGYDVPGTGRDDWTRQSDQGAFHLQGIPFIYFGVEDHPDYHTPRDTFENIQPRFFYHAVKTILDAILIIDQDLHKAQQEAVR